jgi:hypothetical protein
MEDDIKILKVDYISIRLLDHTQILNKQDDIEVVIGRDSPGGNLGLPGESH